jgi:hypothetical protein
MFLHQTYTVTFLFYKDHLCREAEKALIHDVSQKVRNLPWPSNQKEFDIVFVGGLDLNKFNRIFDATEVHGMTSLITGAQKRIHYLFLASGQTDFHIYDMPNNNLLPCEHEEMPSWPAGGSVRLVGTTAIVKLSEPVQQSFD